VSERRAPAWLGELQARFGEMLRTPLDRSEGRLCAQPERYSAQLVRSVRNTAQSSASERLAVYHRQYWFRLLSVFQASYPLTVRLLGHWHFNEHAARFLSERPPASDLSHVADGFAEALDTYAVSDTIREGARIDHAYRRVSRARPEATYRPSGADAERLLTGQLVLSASAAIVHEHWPLCELRRALLAASDESEAPLPTPEALAAPQSLLLLGDSLQLQSLVLEPREATLLDLLRTHPVGVALALLEEQCSAAERAALPAQAQRWLSRSVQRGVWSALAEP